MIPKVIAWAWLVIVATVITSLSLYAVVAHFDTIWGLFGLLWLVVAGVVSVVTAFDTVAK